MKKAVIILIVAVLGGSCSKKALQKSDVEADTFPVTQEKVVEELPIVEI